VKALGVAPPRVMDLEKVWAMGLEMKTLKVLERARGKGLAMEKELETEREMVWVMETAGVCR
jgi:hypothetical protein